jgi:hypothetical protein
LSFRVSQMRDDIRGGAGWVARIWHLCLSRSGVAHPTGTFGHAQGYADVKLLASDHKRSGRGCNPRPATIAERRSLGCRLYEQAPIHVEALLIIPAKVCRSGFRPTDRPEARPTAGVGCAALMRPTFAAQTICLCAVFRDAP